MLENTSQPPKYSPFHSLRNLSFNQKIALGILCILIVLLPLVGYGVYQQTLLQSGASNGLAPSVPVPSDAVLKFQSANSGGSLKVDFVLDLRGKSIDGVQMVAYLDARPQLYTLPQTTVDAANAVVNDNFKVASNSISYEESNKRYKITYALISKNPSKPYTNTSAYTIGTIKLVPISRPDPKVTFPITFDGSITKVVSNSTGENLAVYKPSLLLSFAAQNTPTPSATPTPTGTPKPTTQPTATPNPSSQPTPTPKPTATPFLFNTKIDIIYKPQGFNGPNKINTQQPGLQSVMWDPKAKTQLYTKHVNPHNDTSKGIQVERMEFGLAGSLNAVFYLKPDKHLSTMVPVVLDPARPAVVDISNKPIPVGDLNGDNVIDLDDYHRLVRAFNPTRVAPGIWEDLNYDGKVDIDDYALLAGNFNPNYKGPSFP